MYDWCGVRVGECEADESQILSFVKNQPLDELTKGVRSFAVRSTRIGGTMKAIQRVKLERDVGSVVKESVPRLTVELEHPDLTFACILYGTRLLVWHIGCQETLRPNGDLGGHESALYSIPPLCRRRSLGAWLTLPEQSLAKRSQTLFAELEAF